MKISFKPVLENGLSVHDFAQPFTREKLIQATNEYYDTLLRLIKNVDFAQMSYVPDDPHANDPYAAPENQHVGWSVSHLILHVTASCEESAAISSMLARGVVVTERLRYEPKWHTITSRDQIMQRLTESRRMCLAYLETWPDVPHLDMVRPLPEGAPFPPRNAIASYVSGLVHGHRHIDQIRRTAKQAKAALKRAW